MRKILTILIIVLMTEGLRASTFTGEDRNDTFTVHGRLSCYNGGSLLRIWIIGSTRILYVCEDTPVVGKVYQIYQADDSWFKKDIFADFTVKPLAPDIKGHMRPVQILAIKHVVITQDGKVIAEKDGL